MTSDLSRKAGGCFISDMSGPRARWAEYFDHLYTEDPPSGQLPAPGLQIVDDNPPIDDNLSSLCKIEGWKGCRYL